MKLDFPAVRKCLNSFDLKSLFREHIGWDNHQSQLDVVLDGVTYSLRAIAEKRGFVAYQCSTIPERPIRLKIDHQVTKSAREHIIVYADQRTGQQVWQWVRREPGKPLASRDHRYSTSQSGDALVQRLEQLAVSLDEEEKLTVVEVASRARAAFNVEKVTKQFYERFKAEHTVLQKFIKGIPELADLQWYTSLMLNRLMFVYFIQKKGFLDGDTGYLRNRMKLMQNERGKDKFVTFYRYFLLRLFHEGLGQPNHEAALEKLLGNVPYLNGGFFEVHQLEEKYPEIEIPDKAFEKLFDFFDLYNWHLDERPLRKDNEINPDVVGYIFEKYINQKQMGAYYTKEDITEYNSKYTIIPFLFDAAEKKCPIAFKPGSYLWALLKENPDRYIYAAVRHGVIDAQGVVIPLPKEIEAGISDVSKRDSWNKPAPEPFALPTETWREYVARRTRCLELRVKLRAGDVHSINDFITLNLDIWQFARDAIISSEGPELLRAFWQAIEKLTVLDPTCGSGAFLFAALRILESLYSDCLERMDQFVAEQPANDRHPERFTDFKAVLERTAKHPSQQYFILKSIIISNLFGVDIMEEAVEICKLRLFLKLISQVDTIGQIEPLPDVDFNIRPGNTLVGYARQDEVENNLNFGNAVTRIIQMAGAFDILYQQFRAQQLADPTMFNNESARQFKRDMRAPLGKARDELDRFLAVTYAATPKQFEQWHKQHQPFHWFVEFYAIMRGGGFDVIIGNPPWAEYASVKKRYSVKNFKTEKCGNLHGLCTERSLRLRSPLGSFSFIVQLPLTNSSRMDSVRSLLKANSADLHVLPFDDRPGKLFEGLQHCRSVIFISRGLPLNGQGNVFVTKYQRWPTEARDGLFHRLAFTALPGSLVFPGHFPKLATEHERSAFDRVLARSTKKVRDLVAPSPTKHFVFYQEATQYWVKAVVGLPYYAKNGKVGAPAHGRYIYVKDEVVAQCLAALMNSSLFYAYFIAYGDCFHLSDTLATGFPIVEQVIRDSRLSRLGKDLCDKLRKDAVNKTISTKGGDLISYAEFVAANSKDIIDQIDTRLAQLYGFDEAEVEFVVSYDIKFRMGAEDEPENE